MKFYFYTSTLRECGLSHQERIILSYLIYQSFWFSDDTHLEREEVRSGERTFVSVLAERQYELTIEEIHYAHIGKDLGITRQGVSHSIKQLQQKNIISEDERTIFLGEEFDGQYFELLVDSGLKRMHLITYSYLRHLLDAYGQKRCGEIFLRIKQKKIGDVLFFTTEGKNREAMISREIEYLETKKKLICTKRGKWNTDYTFVEKTI